MGKGSGRRPTDEEKYQDNWERIFGQTEAAHHLQKELTDAMEKYRREKASEDSLGTKGPKGQRESQ
jgi:hypothetical protein